MHLVEAQPLVEVGFDPLTSFVPASFPSVLLLSSLVFSWFFSTLARHSPIDPVKTIWLVLWTSTHGSFTSDSSTPHRRVDTFLLSFSTSSSTAALQEKGSRLQYSL
ncbi:hypothetical protein BP00DRAFT_422967 [Aspergillus indologenus CBS 114.80]|uniref:Uncharacterized protein n=1 Tax=Aspergillus indologenus CBS 114.80 TaxID=1450541 RepID=A0A2V5JF61_9EURO|nr:hypothetical protein BP00DRAFT_422967 [Aspergillus indologenus CBS 114.80]